MFICLVGQTPITALAEGDDTRVISVPEGLQELLVNESEIQTAEDTDTTEETGEVQGEDAVGEARFVKEKTEEGAMITFATVYHIGRL